MNLNIPIFLIILLVIYSTKSSPIDSNPPLNETSNKTEENSENSQNEIPHDKNNENTVNLNMNRGNRKNELQMLIDQQKNIQNLLENAYQTATPANKQINVFSIKDLEKLKEHLSERHQLEQSQSKPSESIRNLQSRGKTPMEKIFENISKSNFRVRGLIIINNNNNNNNIDEDKFTIDEIVKLLEKKDYIGYKDIVEYDHARRLKALKARQPKEEGIRPLKIEAVAGEATQMLNTNETDSNENESKHGENIDQIVNSNHEHDPISSLSMLKATKTENIKPLQLDIVIPDQLGPIIINNKNNNNNEKVTNEIPNTEPVNIVNSNNGVELPMDKLNEADIKSIMENSIIVNNDNNNNNIT